MSAPARRLDAKAAVALYKKKHPDGRRWSTRDVARELGFNVSVVIKHLHRAKAIRTGNGGGRPRVDLSRHVHARLDEGLIARVSLDARNARKLFFRLAQLGEEQLELTIARGVRA